MIKNGLKTDFLDRQVMINNNPKIPTSEKRKTNNRFSIQKVVKKGFGVERDRKRDT